MSTPAPATDGLLRWTTCKVQGRPAAYGEAGRGPVLVFVHGWAVTNRTYKAALKRLAQRGMHVVAPALPGFGGTAPLPDGRGELEDFAQWLLAFLDTVLGDGPVTLVGHSFGGGVAIRAAYEAPERVRGLVLLNSIGGSAWRRHGSVVQALKARPLWDWGLHLPRDIRPGRQLTRVLPVIVRDAFGNALRNPRAVWHAAHVARESDLTDELEALKRRRLPVVVVWGEQDEIITRDSIASLVAALGAPEVVTVAGSHSWLLSDPDEFGEVITNVLPLVGHPGHDGDGPDELRSLRAV